MENINLVLKTYWFFRSRLENSSKCFTSVLNDMKDKFYPNYRIQVQLTGIDRGIKIYDEQNNLMVNEPTNIQVAKALLDLVNKQYNLGLSDLNVGDTIRETPKNDHIEGDTKIDMSGIVTTIDNGEVTDVINPEEIYADIKEFEDLVNTKLYSLAAKYKGRTRISLIDGKIRLNIIHSYKSKS